MANDLVLAEQKAGGRHRFAKGNTYGRKGRPIGSKVKLSESFLAGIAADFAKYGKDVIQHVRQNEPSTYLRIVASIVPRETIAKLEVSGEVEIKHREQRILAAYRLLGEDIARAEIIQDGE
jgi:hypothetical protein